MILSLSGGLDSASLLAAYRDRIKLAVFFNYGSRQNEVEKKYSKSLAEHFGVEWREIDVINIFKNIKSRLLSNVDVADRNSCLIPFRNAIFLSILASIAESNEIKQIALASHSSDCDYPDCSIEFSKSFNTSVKLGTGGKVEFFSPFINLTKAEIAKIGIENGLDPNMTYSCYNGSEVECGACKTCRQKKEALEFLNKC